jgi:hypothetical protein
MQTEDMKFMNRSSLAIMHISKEGSMRVIVIYFGVFNE